MAKNIEVTLTLDSKQFNRGINKAKNSMAGFGGQSKVATGAVVGLAARLVPLAAGFLAIKGSVDGLSKSLGVSAQFEDVGIVLESIVGSAAGAAVALDVITEAATKLPFAFEDLAGAAPALATVSDNIGDLEDNMMLAADLAASFGIPFEVAASQLQRSFSAGAGAADVFREKGILAAAGFEAGVSYSIEETQAKLREFGGTIEDSAQRLNTTFNGAVSQAGDAMTLFQKAVGDAFRPEATAFLSTLTEKFRENKDEIMAFAKAIGQNALRGFIAFLKAGATVIDMMTSIGQVAKRIAQGFRQNFGEQIRTVANFLVKAFGLIVEGIGLVGQGIGKLIEVTTGVDSVTTFFENMTDAANKLRTEGLDAIDDVSEGLGTFIPVTTARDAINELVDDFTAGGQEIRDDIEKTKNESKGLGRELAINLTNGVADADAAIRKLRDQSSTIVSTISKLFGGVGINFQKMLDDDVFQKITGITKEMIEEFSTMDAGQLAMVSLAAELENLFISTEQYNAALKFLTTSYEDLNLTVDEAAALISLLNEKFENQTVMRNFVENLNQGIDALSNDLVSAFEKGESAGDVFKNFFKNMIKQVIADIIKLMVFLPILQAFGFNVKGGTITGFSNPFKSTGAGGGNVMANRPMLVGEQGPELFTPAGSGTLTANHQMGTQVTYNITATDAPSFQALVASDPQFIYAVTQAGARSIPGAR